MDASSRSGSRGIDERKRVSWDYDLEKQVPTDQVKRTSWQGSSARNSFTDKTRRPALYCESDRPSSDRPSSDDRPKRVSWSCDNEKQAVTEARQEILGDVIPEVTEAETEPQVGSPKRTHIRPLSVSTTVSSFSVNTTISEADTAVTVEGYRRQLRQIRSIADARQALRWFSGYQKLFAFVCIANLVTMILFFLLPLGRKRYIVYASAATPCAANILMATFIRNEHVVNFLFWLSVNVPDTWPFWIRRFSGKVYNYGGIHSGCAVSAVAWYMLLVGLGTEQVIHGNVIRPTPVIIAWFILAILVLIVVFAHPRIRIVHHNTFENVHRFAGWSVVGLFWVQIMLILADTSSAGRVPMGQLLVKNATFWCLLLTTLLIIYPWTRLRLKKIRVEPLSAHAVRLHFSYKVRRSVGAAIRLADNPLKENHSFATIPDPNNRDCFSVVVSNAGDWTKKTIKQPPERLWVRGAPVRGVLRVATLFNPVVVVATGSGIAPCLSLFVGKPKHRCHIIWSTQNPLQTYGEEILGNVLDCDPQALIIDTKKSGRPHLVNLAYNRVKETGAEGVIIISNKRVTDKTVYGLRALGIPTRAPIFDS